MPPLDITPRRGLGTAVVRGRSMLPTLRDGDVLLVRFGARPKVGRLALVQLPHGRPLSVKRIIRSGSGGWWLERDNPAEGVDSWQIGSVPEADIRAVVIARLWPRPRWRP